MSTEPDIQVTNGFTLAMDNTVVAICKCASWLNVALIFAIIVQVVLRYVFGMGLVVLEELQWHLYCVNVVFGLAYCLVVDSHIRLDLIYERASRPFKERVEFWGIIILLIPLTIIIFLHSVDFFWEAVKVNERSDAPTGLCCRWLPKGFLPIAMVMLGMALSSRLVKAHKYLRAARRGA